MALNITRRDGERTQIGDCWVKVDAIHSSGVDLTIEFPDYQFGSTVNFGEEFLLSEGIVVTPRCARGKWRKRYDQVQLAITAPKEIKILREELVA